jgi:nitroreductase
MDLFEAIEQRHSVRAYSDKKVKTEDLEKIIAAARLAPTARGEQPWEFIMVTEKEKLEKIGALAKNGEFIKKAAAGVVVVSRDTKYYIEDGSAATQNILLASAALGIGSCWIAGDKKPYAQDILDLFGVPPGYKLVSMISLGYPEGKTEPHAKKGTEQVIHYEQF